MAVALDAAGGYALVGVDVGGSKTAVRVLDGHGRTRSLLAAPTDVSDPARTLAGIRQAIEQAVAQAGLAPGAVAAVGLGVPGRVESAAGLVRLAVNLNWRDVPAGPWLAEALGAPCFIENDVRAAALGVWGWLAQAGQRPPQNLAYLSVGTGVAAGLILEGRLYTGPRGMAGEIGHVVADPAGPSCACGVRGCLEALVAGPAIARRARQLASESGQATRLRGPAPLTAQAVYEAAAAGDAVALAVAEEAGGWLGRAVHALVMAYDVEAVVLGGGVARGGQPFLQPILRELDRLRRDSALAREMLPPDVVRLLPPDFEAGTWGALALARQGLRAPESRPVPAP